MEWLRTIVRPIVTFAITGMFIYGVVKGKIPWSAATPIVSFVLVFWFQEKTIERVIERVLGIKKD